MYTYLSIAAESTNPPSCRKYDGRSVPPPPSDMRNGVLVMITGRTAYLPESGSHRFLNYSMVAVCHHEPCHVSGCRGMISYESESAASSAAFNRWCLRIQSASQKRPMAPASSEHSIVNHA